MLKLKQKFQGCALTAPDWRPEAPGNLKSKAGHPRFHCFRALGCHCEQFFGEHRLEAWKLILTCYSMKINIKGTQAICCFVYCSVTNIWVEIEGRNILFIPFKSAVLLTSWIWLAESNAVFSKHTAKMRNYKANISDNGAWWLANKQQK